MNKFFFKLNSKKPNNKTCIILWGSLLTEETEAGNQNAQLNQILKEDKQVSCDLCKGTLTDLYS